MDTQYGLIFDVDGVIADTERVNAEASIRMFSECFGLHGVRREDFEAGLGRGAASYVKAAARVHGLELTPEQVALATDVRQRVFLETLACESLPAFPGVLELMRAAMDDAEFAVAIATSSTRDKSEAVLRSARIPYRELAYITGSDVQHKKPHPELFLKAASAIGVPPASCVVIEDAPTGVAAAHAAGCHSIAVTNSTQAAQLAEADRIVSSLSTITMRDIRELARLDNAGTNKAS